MSGARAVTADDIDFLEAEPWTVLIVDDSPLWRQVIRDAVLRFDRRTRIIEAGDGLEALDKLKSLEIDIVFLDLALPQMNGGDIVRAVNASRRMPFFAVVSGVATTSDVEDLKRMLAYDFLEKPFPKGEIERVLRTYAHASHRRRMLIVDDSRTTCNLVRRVVSRSIFRFDVSEVTDGVAAVEAYSKSRHDVIVIDLNMPGLNGSDLLRVFRACYPGFRAIMMSARHDELQALQDEAIIGRLPKPFTPADLDRILHIAFHLPLPYAAQTRT